MNIYYLKNILKYNILKYIETAKMTARDYTNNGILYLVFNSLLKFIYLVPVLMLWQNLVKKGIKIDMSLDQLLTYTFLGAIFSEILLPQTPASNWMYEGLIINLYMRPMGIMPHLIFQTFGKWVVQLLFYSMPMILLAPLFNVSLKIHSWWFILSLVLCISLGFAVDFMFACLIIYVKTNSWVAYTIRFALISLFSGSVIPFSILPYNIGDFLKLTPFGSLSGSTLSIYTGMENPMPIIITQIIWNILLWPISIRIFNKMHERMVSYGG